MNADGSDQTAVPGTAGGSNPVWSPDGEQLAFVRFLAGGSDLFLVGPDGSGLMPLTNDAALQFQPAWAPTGDSLVVAQSPAANSTAFQLFTMEADGTGVTPLPTGGGTAVEFNPVWQTLGFPNGCTIIGTLGNDTLAGTAGPDTICGLAGNDTLRGRRAARRRRERPDARRCRQRPTRWGRRSRFGRRWSRARPLHGGDEEGMLTGRRASGSLTTAERVPSPSGSECFAAWRPLGAAAARGAAAPLATGSLRDGPH